MITFNELKKLKEAGSYISTETRALNFSDKKAMMKILVASPLKYEDAMANEDFKKIYSIINSTNYAVADRVFAVTKDFETLIINKNETLFSIENKIPLNEFDICIFCIPDELTLTNVINIMNLGKIDITKNNKDENDDNKEEKTSPYIIGTGNCILGNEESLSDLFDILVLGEPEVTIKNVLDLLYNTLNLKEYNDKYIKSKLIKDRLYKNLSNLSYVYIKGYNENVKYEYLKEYTLDTPKHLVVPSIPSKENVSSVRVTKGCNRGCINCNNKYIYDKMYEKAVDYTVLDSIKYIENTGMRDLLLKSNCYFDYTNKNDLIYYLKNERKIRSIHIENIFFDKTNLILLDLLDKNEIPKIKIDSSNENLRKTIRQLYN